MGNTSGLEHMVQVSFLAQMPTEACQVRWPPDISRPYPTGLKFDADETGATARDS